jgi:hypothetical protein
MQLDSIYFFLSKSVIKNYIIKRFKGFISTRNHNRKFEHLVKVATLGLDVFCNLLKPCYHGHI